MRNSIITKCTTYSREGSWKMKKWVSGTKSCLKENPLTSIDDIALLAFFPYCFNVCVTFSICFLGFGHALFEWVVWETKPKKSQGLWSNELRWQFYLNWNNWAWKITTIIYFTMWIQLSLAEPEKKFLFTYI